jgi:hypothetical protein
MVQCLAQLKGVTPLLRIWASMIMKSRNRSWLKLAALDAGLFVGTAYIVWNWFQDDPTPDRLFLSLEPFSVRRNSLSR